MRGKHKREIEKKGLLVAKEERRTKKKREGRKEVKRMWEQI